MNISLSIHKKNASTLEKINMGQKIKLSDIEVKGPAGGILPKYTNIIIGRKARKQILQDHPILWESI